jgi:DNA-binding CsgD family transcriptional regulator
MLNAESEGLLLNTFRLEDVLDAMAAAPSLDHMNSLLLTIKENYGLANVVYRAAKLPGCNLPNPILLLSYEPNWIKQYHHENYFDIDPTIEHGDKSFLPLDWSQINKKSSSVKHFFKQAETNGVGRQGVTIPIRGPNGERALFGVTSNLSNDEWEKKRMAFIRDYHALAHFFHDRAVFLSGIRGAPPKLSNRETQCVSMLANGFQPKVIAYQLGISESAVRLYTKSARHKLRCTTLAQTVAEATRQELISV